MSRGSGRGTVTIDESPKITVLYEDGTVLYVCSASPCSAVSDAVWQVKKVDATTGVKVTWADGDANYDNLATDLATVKAFTYG